MATIKDTAATSALNEDAYINKLYGSSGDAQKRPAPDISIITKAAAPQQ